MKLNDMSPAPGSKKTKLRVGRGAEHPHHVRSELADVHFPALASGPRW